MFTVNVAVVAPEATVTVPGTDATPALELLRVTTAPDGPAGPVRVMVPVELIPPNTDVGFREMDESDVGVIVSLAVRFVPPRPAVIVATVWASTPEVVTLKVADTLPAGTLTVVGTVAAWLSEESVIVTPAGPASPTSVTVPVDEVPPRTVVGLNMSDEILATPIVKGAL